MWRNNIWFLSRTATYSIALSLAKEIWLVVFVRCWGLHRELADHHPNTTHQARLTSLLSSLSGSWFLLQYLHMWRGNRVIHSETKSHDLNSVWLTPLPFQAPSGRERRWQEPLHVGRDERGVTHAPQRGLIRREVESLWNVFYNS